MIRFSCPEYLYSEANCHSKSAHSTNSFLKLVELALQLVVPFQPVVYEHQLAEMSDGGDFLKSACSFGVDSSTDLDCDDFSPTAHNCWERMISAHGSDHYFSNKVEFFAHTTFCSSDHIYDRCGTFDRFGMLNRCYILSQHTARLGSLSPGTLTLETLPPDTSNHHTFDQTFDQA